MNDRNASDMCKRRSKNSLDFSITCTRSGNTVGCPSSRTFVAGSDGLVILSFLQCAVELIVYDAAK